MDLQTRINELSNVNFIRRDRPGPRQRLIDLIKKIYNSLENHELFLQFLDPENFTNREEFVAELNKLNDDFENSGEESKQNALELNLEQLNNSRRHRRINILRTQTEDALNRMARFDIQTRINVDLYEAGLLGYNEELIYTTILKIVSIYNKIFRYYNLLYDFLNPDNFEDYYHFDRMLDKLDTALQARNGNEKEILENILGDYQTIEVRNHEGELETRRVRIPRQEEINVETTDFNRGQPNPRPPKMVPFNFKRPWKFDGECVICMDTEPQSWCRVNCPAGHTFHCACIKEYTNTLKNTNVVGYVFEEGNFNDQCPLCNKRFTQLSELPDPKGLINRFGKKSLYSDLRYLLKLK